MCRYAKWIVLVIVIVAWGAVGQAKVGALVLSGPMTMETYPLLVIAERHLLSDVAKKTIFVPWNNPDQIRALIVGSKVDFAVVPTPMAVNFYNKKARVRAIDFSFPHNLWIVSADKRCATLKDLVGCEIAMPFHGDMPGIIFSLLAGNAGLVPEKDFSFRYAATPIDAVQLLMLGRVDHAFLGEPAVSAAMIKAAAMTGQTARPLYRSVDMQQEWRLNSGHDFLLPLACTVAVDSNTGTDPVVLRFQQAYQTAMDWCRRFPEDTGKLAARHFPVLKPAVVAGVIRSSPWDFKSAKEARSQTDSFLRLLHRQNPGVIGGNLPGEDFYWQEP